MKQPRKLRRFWVPRKVNNDKSGKKDNVMMMVGRYSSLAMLLPAATFTGYVIGYGLDYLFSTRFLRFVFLGVGIVAGFVQLIRELSREPK